MISISKTKYLTIDNKNNGLALALHLILLYLADS